MTRPNSSSSSSSSNTSHCGHRDHGHLKHDDMQMRDNTEGPLSSSSGQRLNYFPSKLHYMLSELQKDGLDHIVSWQPHGRCFLVHNEDEFVKEILPMWFCQSKFASFQRQLNLYGFRRLTKGVDKGGFYHEMFLRGKQSLAAKIQRIPKAGAGASRSRPTKLAEPNFYAMPDVPVEKEDPLPPPNSKSSSRHLGDNAGGCQFSPALVAPECFNGVPMSQVAPPALHRVVSDAPSQAPVQTKAPPSLTLSASGESKSASVLPCHNLSSIQSPQSEGGFGGQLGHNLSSIQLAQSAGALGGQLGIDNLSSIQLPQGRGVLGGQLMLAPLHQQLEQVRLQREWLAKQRSILRILLSRNNAA